MTNLGAQLAELSRWIDEANSHRNPEAQLWGRVAKVSEETGEAIAALVGATGQNPRKGFTHTTVDVVKELLDVAVTALAAVEHLVNNDGSCVSLLESHVDGLMKRAGLAA